MGWEGQWSEKDLEKPWWWPGDYVVKNNVKDKDENAASPTISPKNWNSCNTVEVILYLSK